MRASILILVLWFGAIGAAAASAQGSASDEPVRDERSLAYRFDAELGWFPKANDTVSYTGTRTIRITHNSMGFRDREHPSEKVRPRLVFIGDSFVWGYDVEQGERFTDLLDAELTSIDVMNLGVSGYGTDQCYLLIQKYFDRLEPDAVVYMFSETDLLDNSVNFNYRAYYKPYFVVEKGQLELRGVPVPRASVWSRIKSRLSFPRLRHESGITTRIISALDAFVKGKGASFAVGLVDDDEALRKHLETEKIVYFDVSHVDHRYRYDGHGFHWTPEGHRLVAQAVKAFLLHNSAAR